MRPFDVLSKELSVRWDDDKSCLMIDKVQENGELKGLVQIRDYTFDEMSFEEASKFLGQRIILLIPWLRSKYNKEFPFPDEE